MDIPGAPPCQHLGEKTALRFLSLLHLRSLFFPWDRKLAFSGPRLQALAPRDLGNLPCHLFRIIWLSLQLHFETLGRFPFPGCLTFPLGLSGVHSVEHGFYGISLGAAFPLAASISNDYSSCFSRGKLRSQLSGCFG